MRAVIVSKGWLTLQGDVGHFLGFRDPIHHTPDFFKCMVQSTFFSFLLFLDVGGSAGVSMVQQRFLCWWKHSMSAATSQMWLMEAIRQHMGKLILLTYSCQ